MDEKLVGTEEWIEFSFANGSNSDSCSITIIMSAGNAGQPKRAVLHLCQPRVFSNCGIYLRLSPACPAQGCALGVCPRFKTGVGFDYKPKDLNIHAAAGGRHSSESYQQLHMPFGLRLSNAGLKCSLRRRVCHDLALVLVFPHNISF